MGVAGSIVRLAGMRAGDSSSLDFCRDKNLEVENNLNLTQ